MIPMCCIFKLLDLSSGFSVITCYFISEIIIRLYRVICKCEVIRILPQVRSKYSVWIHPLPSLHIPIRRVIPMPCLQLGVYPLCSCGQQLYKPLYLLQFVSALVTQTLLVTVIRVCCSLRSIRIKRSLCFPYWMIMPPIWWTSWKHDFLENDNILSGRVQK